MAHAYTRPGTRFWWVKYRDPKTGKVVRKSTGIDVVAPNARRDALGVAAEWTQKEMSAPRTNEKERWEAWAALYFQSRYGHSLSAHGANTALRDLVVYFREKGIRTPRQVDYAACADFIPWRMSGECLEKVGRNTACTKFIYFTVLMAEAVRRGYAPSNPCREVETRRTPPKEKNEITEGHQSIIETALRGKKEWMQEQWLVLMRQGCRIAETIVPMERINTDQMTITFRLKGGRLHVAQLHPDLLPLIAKARAQNRATLIEGPRVSSMAAIWCIFFNRLKLPYSIHCTRVTVITRLIRADQPPAKICNFIGHTEEVNRIYRKLKPSDSSALLDILGGASNRA